MEKIDNNKCVWCKKNRENWHEDTLAIGLDSGEIVCNNCLNDMRRFKVEESIVLYKNNEMPEEVHEFFSERFNELLKVAAERFENVGIGGSRLSNAEEYDEEGDY